MSSLTTPSPALVGEGLLPLSFPDRQGITRVAYHAMAEAGLIDPDAAVELLNGEIVPMSPIGYQHNTVVDDLNEFFVSRLSGRFRCRCQGAQATSEVSEPEPDFQILELRDDRYRSGHPDPNSIRLVIEVSDSSLKKDTGPKMQIYAAAGIGEYWVIDLVNRQLLVHTEPDQANAVYRSVVTHDDQAKVAPGVASDCELDLAWLLGPPKAK